MENLITSILRFGVKRKDAKQRIANVLLTAVTAEYKFNRAIFFLADDEVTGDNYDTLTYSVVLAKGPGTFEEYKEVIRRISQQQLALPQIYSGANIGQDTTLNDLVRDTRISLQQNSIFRVVATSGYSYLGAGKHLLMSH